MALGQAWLIMACPPCTVETPPAPALALTGLVFCKLGKQDSFHECLPLAQLCRAGRLAPRALGSCLAAQPCPAPASLSLLPAVLGGHLGGLRRLLLVGKSSVIISWTSLQRRVAASEAGTDKACADLGSQERGDLEEGCAWPRAPPARIRAHRRQQLQEFKHRGARPPGTGACGGPHATVQSQPHPATGGVEVPPTKVPMETAQGAAATVVPELAPPVERQLDSPSPSGISMTNVHLRRCIQLALATEGPEAGSKPGLGSGEERPHLSLGATAKCW